MQWSKFLADAGFLCDKEPELVDTIKYTLYFYPFTHIKQRICECNAILMLQNKQQ
jgi:hypothetical protein